MLEDLVPSSESCLIECVERERVHVYVQVCVCVFSLFICVYLYILFGYIMHNNKGIFPGYENWFLLLYLDSHVSHQWLPKLTTQRIIAKYGCRDCADTDSLRREWVGGKRAWEGGRLYWAEKQHPGLLCVYSCQDYNSYLLVYECKRRGRKAYGQTKGYFNFNMCPLDSAYHLTKAHRDLISIVI